MDLSSGPDLVAVVKSLQERAATMVEMADGAEFYFCNQLEYDEKARAKFFTADKAELFDILTAELNSCPEFSEEALEQAFAHVMEKQN